MSEVPLVFYTISHISRLHEDVFLIRFYVIMISKADEIHTQLKYVYRVNTWLMTKEISFVLKNSGKTKI